MRRTNFKKIPLELLILFTILLWGYGTFGEYIGAKLGYTTRKVSISGTGSMYPTFPKGEGTDPKKLSQQIVETTGMFPYPNGLFLFGQRLFNYTLTRGDIVVAHNKKIDDLSQKLYGEPGDVIKRLIALPGDVVQLRDGIVYLNGVPQKEPYTAKPRSTFGGSTLSECTPLRIPPHKYFIMGDNRKGSSDSRANIGLIDEQDISYVLPMDKQTGPLKAHWRDTTHDLEETAKIHLNSQQFLALLNTKRAEAKTKALRYEPKLELSARKRGIRVLADDDFSTEASRSGYTMERAMADAGYSNIVYGEWVIQGYYEADELLEQLFEQPNGKQFLLNPEYQDMGVTAVEGFVHDCPSQVIILHVAGYQPPTYSKELIASWVGALSQLREIQPGWQTLRERHPFYEHHKQEVDRINEIIDTRIRSITGIVDKMHRTLWLTQAEEKALDTDDALAKEQQELAKKLNSYTD